MSQFLLFYYQNNDDYKKAATDFICVAGDSFLPFFFFCLVRSPIPLTYQGEQKQTCSVLENPLYVVTRPRLLR